jgi:FdhE protein
MTVPGTAVDPINIGNVAQPPFVRLPDPKTLFQRRAARLQTLSRDHPMADYLQFIAALVRVQADVIHRLPAGTLPGPDQVDFFHEHKLPLVDRLTWRRDPSWQAAFGGILDGLAPLAMPDPARSTLDELKSTSPDGREGLADRVLGIDPAPADAAQACFVSAVLQVYWTRMAAVLDQQDVLAVEPAGSCPVCGSPAVASVVYAEGSLQGVRFLCCPLCSSEWHCVRIKCANCQSTKGIAYQHIPEQPAVKAETCDECRTYTKILYKDKDPEGEPFADDLATLGLDVLVGEAGWARATPNPFLAPAIG